MLEIIGVILLWPSLVYLFLLAIAVWVIGRLLFAISWSFGLAEKIHDYLHFRLPVLGPVLFFLTHLISKYFNLR